MVLYSKKRLNSIKLIFTLSFILLFNTVVQASGVVVQTNKSNSDKSDYVLIINSYTESSDWSNSFIHPIYESLISDESKFMVYTEHMNMLMINTQEELDQYKQSLFDKYNNTPKAIVLLGNTPWVVLRDELEAKWAGTPVILCAEENYTGPADAYITKNAIPKEIRVPLTDYAGSMNLTVINVPTYLKQTVDLMKKMVPGMTKIMFLSDNRYVGAQCRADLQNLIETDYSDLILENMTPEEFSVNDLSDTLKTADSTTGILYLSWYQKSMLSGNIVLTTNSYKMFSRYTTAPVFTLSDNLTGTVGMLGGYFFTNNQIKEITKRVVNAVLSDNSHKKITVENCGVPTPVVNYIVLKEKGISISLCPEDTFFYMKQLTVWELYKYWILLGFFIILFGFVFLMMRIRMLGNIRARQAEKLLLVQNYTSLFDNMPIAYSKQKLVYDDNGEMVDYVVVEKNPYFEKYFTSDGDTLLQTSGQNQIHSSFKEFRSLYEMALSDKKEITVQYYHQATGRYFSMLIVKSKVEGYMDVFYVDNTELSTTQQLLRTLNHKLSLALEVANITPWRWDLEKGAIVCDANRMAASMSESITEDQISVPYDQYFSKICKRDLDRVRQAYDDLLSGKINKIKEEYRVFVHYDNKRTYEWVETQAVIDKRDENKRPLSLIGSSLVISDRKKMETDLIDAKNRAEESNRLKSAFLANMSHEIRTPLNAIVGFSEVLASADNEDDKREYVGIIENNNTLLLQLISDILDLSKIEAGTLEFIYSDIDIYGLFIELETSFKMRLNDKSAVDIIFENNGQDHFFVNTDRSRLTQVVINMVNNAMKFTEQGSIRFGYTLRENKTIYFYIKDTGCGIAPENLESIFGRFVKLNNFAQGTGLGLSICQTIIYHMGGEIGVESKEGEGSTFWFTIPYKPGKLPIATLAKEIVVPEMIEKNKLTVLIAEDNASNYKLFDTILKGEYIIYHAWDGEEAVSMFKEHKPHIVLMDINMPKMNGYEATKQIRDISAKVPIIAVTAYAYSSDEQRINENGFDGYTAKPINSQMLKSQMINLLKRQLIFM